MYRELIARDTSQMTDEPPRADRDADATPRWVKIFAAIALALVVLVAVLLVTGRGGHGPGRHAPSDDSGGHAGRPAGITHGEP